MGFGSPFEGFMFSFLPLFSSLVFILVFVLFAVFILKNITAYFRNSGMPKETLPARLIGKRTHAWRGNGNMAGHTSYYVTFELENGERMEFPVGSDFYGLHAEGDAGLLTHQGTRFYNFERERI